MAVRPHHTILLLTRNLAVRADVAGAALNVSGKVREVRATAGDAAAMLLRSAAPAKNVWVVCDETFAQTVALQPQQTFGLPPEALERALAFEAEPFSGFPPDASVVAYHRMPGTGLEETFQIVQAPRELLEALRKTVTAAGATLAGLTHPSGLTEVAQLPEQYNPPALEAWLKPWARAFAAGAAELPLIRVPAPPTPAATYVLAGAAALLLAVAGCWLHHRSIVTERETLNAKISEANGPAQLLTAARKRRDDIKKEVDALRQSNQVREYEHGILHGTLSEQRRSLGRLVEELAAARPENAVIDAIEPAAGGATIRGLAIDARDADTLAATLAERLRGSGWQIQPQEKKALRRFENGGPYYFTLLAARVAAPAKVPTAPKTPAAPMLPEGVGGSSSIQEPRAANQEPRTLLAEVQP